jgi:rare lipoprotein A (peptidoglycan hydrolase)
VGTDLVCGDCVQISNTRTNAQLVVQVVDKGGNIFDLSQQAFNTLDTDGNGYFQGHLDITYLKVSCSGSSATSTPTTTTTATPSTGCGSCQGCLWTYSGGSQCFTNSVEAACDTYGSEYTWCA